MAKYLTICITVPRDRLERNLVLLKRSKSAGTLKTQKAIRQAYSQLYHSGDYPLKTVVELAKEHLDEKNFELLIKSLVRKTKRNAVPDIIDIAICELDAAGELHCNATEASGRVADWLQKKEGLSYKLKLTPDTYRKRIKKLRRRGVDLAL